MPEINANYLILFAGFVLPGAISMYVYSLKVPQDDRDLKDRVLEAICFSILNFVFFLGVVSWLLQDATLDNHPVAGWATIIAVLVLAPVIWPELWDVNEAGQFVTVKDGSPGVLLRPSFPLQIPLRFQRRK